MKLAVTATPRAGRFSPLLLRGSMADAVVIAAKLGFDGVEVHLRHPEDIDKAAFAKLVATYGLEVPTVGTGLAAVEDGLTLSDPDPEIRRRAVGRVKEHIGFAAEVGSAVTIGLIAGNLGDNPQKRSVLRGEMLESLFECCQAARDVGVMVLLEPINRYESDHLNTQEQGLEILQEVGAPNMKLLCDIFHMNIEEIDISGTLRRVGKNLGHVHLVDSNRQVPGHGHLDFRGVLNTLSDVDYHGYLSFEALPIPDSHRAAEDGLRTVRSLLAEL